MRFRDFHTRRIMGGLDWLVRARKPRLVELCGDPWGAELSLTDESCAALFGAIAASVCRVVIVTRCPERARAWFDWLKWAGDDGAERACVLAALDFGLDVGWPPVENGRFREARWPIPNAILATEVRTQAEADARIPALLDCPAALRAVRVVPTERVDVSPWLGLGCAVCGDRVPDAGRFTDRDHGHGVLSRHSPSWVLVSGATDGAPTDLVDVRDLVRQCREAGVPVWCDLRGSRLLMPVTPFEQSAESMLRHGEYDPEPYFLRWTRLFDAEFELMGVPEAGVRELPEALR